ncbi:multidrug resistance-associated protein, putative [Trypanosoma brucei brucei TREU927]|uniref:ABC-type xenobiotic transporter n=1 Tax=Trypanosoma brucei brucei (strain 927/4 GUTat10.1) TaxID=185431 RepID=Q584D6_TRYB2|nr:multidrug resistance-associated protein, putative [Trypanosoma brucei brucei TREU927]AAX79069.1 multidrug resistance-associated protein, putative [Trypanosoma brucei]AAZ10842.1 multidrug resistance-associated protein, putative [Trypanosoma brucei brucei TREU927]
MTTKNRPIEEAAAVYILRIIHTILLWLGVTLGSVLVVCSQPRFVPIRTAISSFVYLLASLCVIFVSILELKGHISTISGVTHWMDRVGCSYWFLLLFIRCIKPSHAVEWVASALLPLLVLTEWAVVTTYILISSTYHPVITVDLFLTVLHTVVFTAFVGLDRLMISDITVIFSAARAAQDADAVEACGGNMGMSRSGPGSFRSDDMLELSHELQSSASSYSSALCRGNSRCYILRVVARRWGGTYAVLVFVRLLYEFGGLLPAHLLRILVDNLSVVENKHGKKHGSDGLCMASVMIVVIIAYNLICTFLRAHYRVALQKIVLYTRGLLTSELFRCTLCRRKHLFDGRTQGDIMNHLSLDVARVADAASSFNDLWALPLQLSLALYLLYIQISFAFVAGVVVSVALIPINMWLTKRIQGVMSELMRENDERVLRITEIVRNIIYVKMCGWSQLVQQWVKESRDRYLVHLRWLKYLDAFCVFFWATTPTLVSLVTFITFILMGGELTPGKAVTALALFNSLTMPLNAYPCVINGLVESYVSWCRLSPFLVMRPDACHGDLYGFASGESDSGTKMFTEITEEYQDMVVSSEEMPCASSLNEIQPLLQAKGCVGEMRRQRLAGIHGLPHPFRRNHDLLIDIRSGVIRLNTQGGAGLPRPSFMLHIPTFQATSGQLIAVVGVSGSGKSTFLDGLAGEHLIDPNDATGHAAVSRFSTAYVEQQPFLMSGTLRENILMGLMYDSVRYEAVINAVALTQDLQTCFYPDGDTFLVGDRGIRLSGGQRARVALARALYAGKELYLIDDILGCLDPTVARHIVTNALVGSAKSGSCVIVATHNQELVERADVVYRCVEGQLLFSQRLVKTAATTVAEPSSPAAKPHATQQHVALANNEKGHGKVGNVLGDVPWPSSDSSPARAPVATPESGSIEAAEVLETSKHGTLAWETLACYIGRVGWKLSAFIIISAALMQISRNAGDQYVVTWAKSGDGNTTRFIWSLAILAGVNSVLALARGFSFAFGGLRAAKRLHNELLGHVMSATFTFFSDTPPGRIINRLCGDTYTIDDSLPFIMNILLAQTFLLCGAVVVILLNSSSLLIVTLIPVSVLYHRIQCPYRASSRELRRLEEAANAPLLDTMRDALDGGVVIRSLGGRVVMSHLRRASRNTDLLLRVKFNSMLLGAWFTIRLELVGLLPLIFVGGTAIYYHGSASAPFIGLALAYVQPLTSYVGGLLGAFASTETELISVERVRQYFSLASEEPRTLGMFFSPPLSNWPSGGQVVLSNVSMRYDPSGPEVLRSLSFHVNAGEKVAIVGRTGAGKSSIFSALLRLVEIESGSIHIDGYDTRRLPLEVLRTRLSVLPQQPFIFSGSLRQNIDPFGLHSEDAVRDVATSVKLDGVALDYNVTDSSRVSGGQRHLIALARVILQRSPLLLLDEPTAQSSAEAEAALWSSLAEHLRSTTVLCITHKLSHIDFFDRVIVIENGHVASDGTVAQLRAASVWPFSSPNADASLT